MKAQLQDLSLKTDLLKARYLFLFGALCSPIFYFFMQKIEIGSIDSIIARAILSIICLLGFFSTYYEHKHQETIIRFFYHVGRIGWIALYLYLLHVNHWTIYQRWSYFVLTFMVSGAAFSWKDFLQVASVAIVAPFILGFYATEMSMVELVHFHIANIAPLFLIAVTIHAHYRFKREVEILTKSLVEKSQMAAIGEVAAGVAHEVNSPLMVFSYALHQLKRQSDNGTLDKEKAEALFDKMHRMIGRISNIVNALKVYSVEKTDDNFEAANLNNLIDESLTLCNRRFHEQGITVVRDTSINSEVTCMVKKSQIIQCFMNLFTNAIEACQNLPSPRIEISTIVKESHVYFTITDNGAGVADELAEKIMQPFFTTKEIATGLGLSVSQGIARGHNGELFLNRAISPSSFVLKLPLA